MPLVFAPVPTAFNNFGHLYGPAYPSYPSPKDRYLAAMAQARSAEHEYIQYLQRQQAQEALIRRREEAIRRQQEERARQQLLRHYFCDREYPQSYYVDADEDYYPGRRSHSYCQCSNYHHTHHQSHGCDCRRGQLRRQQELGLKRKQEARQEMENVQRFLSFLLGLQAQSSVPQPVQRRLPPAARRSVPDPYAQLEEAFGSFLSDLTGTAAPEQRPTQEPAKETRKTEPRSARPQSKPQPTPQPRSTLRDILQTRLSNERDVEVVDTIASVIASLFHPQVSSPNAPQPSKEQQQGNGKGKDKDLTPPSITITEPTSADVVKAFDTIRNVETSFRLLESDFDMPRKLDFTPPSTPTASAPSSASLPQLAYTSANAPVHNYTYALSQLLIQLDAVESFGNEEVRARRKSVVSMIERALEGIEGEVEQKGRTSRPQSILVTQEENAAPDAPVANPTQPEADREAEDANVLTSVPVDQPAFEVEASEAQDKLPTDTQSVEPHDIEIPPQPLSIELTLEDAEQDSSNVESTPANVDSDILAMPTVEDSTPTSDHVEVKPYVIDDDASEAIPESSAVEQQSGPTELVDTFLLPATPSPPATPLPDTKADADKDLVILDDGSDGDTWSEVDA